MISVGLFMPYFDKSGGVVMWSGEEQVQTGDSNGFFARILITRQTPFLKARKWIPSFSISRAQPESPADSVQSAFFGSIGRINGLCLVAGTILDTKSLPVPKVVDLYMNSLFDT